MVDPLPDDRHAIEIHDLRCAGHFDLAAALEAERKAWRAAEAKVAGGYERGRRDMLNALLAPNPIAAAKLARMSGVEPDIEGRLPFDVVFWVREVAEQLGIKPLHKCFICAKRFRAGEMVLQDITEGLGHRACYGDDRDSFVNLDTGEPIGADEPLPTGEPYDPAEYPGYAAPDDGGAVAADAGKVREALAAMRAWFGIVVEKIDLDPDDTIVAVSAIGKDGKQEVARRSLRQIFEQADEALS